jgi:hypothetical protein
MKKVCSALESRNTVGIGTDPKIYEKSYIKQILSEL